MKKKKKMLVITGILLVLILAAGGGYQLKYRSGNYSDKRIPMEEVKAEMEAAAGVEIETDGTYLTYGELDVLLGKLHLNDYITYSKERNSKKISQKDWNKIYEQVLDYLDTNQKIIKKELMVLKVSSKERKVYTSEGTFGFSGKLTRTTPFEVYEVYCKDGQLLGLAGKSEKQGMLMNAYLKSVKDGKLTFLFDKQEYKIKTNTKKQSIQPSVCDLVFEKNEVAEIRKKEATIEGKLITMDTKKIEIEGYGQIPLAGRVPVYSDYDGLKEVSMEDIVLDNMKVSYVVGEGMVQAILIHEPADIKNIRVLILNQNSPYYEEIRITSDRDFTVTVNQKDMAYPAGQSVSAKELIGDSTETVLRCTPSEGGSLYSVKEDGSPVGETYSGSFELRKTAEGYTLVNVLDLETYICGVLPSEMPESFEPEALKAQAVCARSYAYIQLMRGDYAALGAHVDDSTNYQVYNKQPCSDKSREAVAATAGEVLKYNGSIIEAYYFSTSCGHTGSMKNWNKSENETNGYLKGVWVKSQTGTQNLAEEESFRNYVSGTDSDAYECQTPYFRWKATLDFNEKNETLRNLLDGMKKASPESVGFILGGAEKENSKGLGALKSVSVAERGDSGSILTLKICFENGEVLLKNEYNIRKLLGCAMTEVVCQDGTKNINSSVLPSAYCSIDYDGATNTAAVTGGGFGHGIGMSQYGANAMAKAGMSYENILKFYYQDITLEKLY